FLLAVRALAQFQGTSPSGVSGDLRGSRECKKHAPCGRRSNLPEAAPPPERRWLLPDRVAPARDGFVRAEPGFELRLRLRGGRGDGDGLRAEGGALRVDERELERNRLAGGDRLVRDRAGHPHAALFRTHGD